ncbi:unnamed protein product, partial [Aphanomyces euteiches]
SAADAIDSVMVPKTALESSSVATCASKSVTTSASMFEPAQSASKSATLRCVAHPDKA